MKNHIAAAVASTSLSLGCGAAAAADFYLCAGEAVKSLDPDGADPAPAVNITVWGFAQVANAAAQAPGCGSSATVPGPTLTVPVGDPTLNVHVYNDALPEPVSIVIPGQGMPVGSTPVYHGAGEAFAGRVRSFTHETQPGATATYTWNNLREGSYLYHTGTHVGLQVHMGLYGGVIKDSGTGEAYPGVPYDNEVVLFYSEIDPALHDPTPTTANARNYQPRYFLVNGEPFTDKLAATLPAGNVGETTLIRFFNASLQTHTPVIQGAYWDLITEDGNLYPYPRTQYSTMLAAMKTKDAVFVPTSPGTRAVYDARRDLSNAGITPGGLLAFFDVGASGAGVEAAEDGYATDEEVALNEPAPGVLGNDTSPVEAILVDDASVGSLALNPDGSFDYTPAPDFNGNAIFSYRASADSNVATVTIMVEPVNDPPAAVADVYDATVDTTLSVPAPGLIANDSDVDGDGLAVTTVPVSGPSFGALTLNSDGSFEYTGTETDNFTYEVCDDGTPELCAIAGVNITVMAAAPNPPVAEDDQASTTRNVPEVIDVIANDSDVDGTIDPATVVIVETPNRGGTATPNLNGTVTYEPRRNFKGTEIFSYMVNDNEGLTSNVANVRVNVTR
jgi:hypothetical protein